MCDQDYLLHRDLSFGQRFVVDQMILFFCRRNIHLYQSLPHAHGDVPKHVFKKDLVWPRSVFRVGCWFDFRIVGFFMSGFRLIISRIGLYTRAVPLKAGMAVPDLHVVPVLACLSIFWGKEFWCAFLEIGFSHLLVHVYVCCVETWV